MKTTVIHHSADFDGLFCREIARKFLPDAELIGWDFGDQTLEISNDHLIYVLDLPLDKPLGLVFMPPASGAVFNSKNIVWIDHHKSAIASHPADIPGYRIDGVAACRLAWQWFTHPGRFQGGSSVRPPGKEMFVQRRVGEPLAVRLAGEYDVWDHRGDGDLEFQFGLDAQHELLWDRLLDPKLGGEYVDGIIHTGRFAMNCYAKRDAAVMRERSFLVDFEGLKFLALNTARCNSNTFSARDLSETGHDALMAFFFNGKIWTVSLYHATHRRDLDLSLIAVKHGGGGHKGACGFTSKTFPLA